MPEQNSLSRCHDNTNNDSRLMTMIDAYYYDPFAKYFAMMCRVRFAYSDLV